MNLFLILYEVRQLRCIDSNWGRANWFLSLGHVKGIVELTLVGSTGHIGKIRSLIASAVSLGSRSGRGRQSCA